MKEYRINENLIEYLLSKGVIISNKEDALKKIERYTYYSIINTYKSVFKNEDGNYICNVSFDEIYALFDFDKEFQNMMQKHSLNTVILLGHLNPDGDAAGSVMGLAHYIKVNYPQYRVIPYLEDTLDKGPKKQVKADRVFDPLTKPDIIDERYAVIVCDTAVLSRLIGKEYYECAETSMVIDHHASNEGYGDINYTKISEACAENVYYILDQAKLKKTMISEMKPTAADYIYMGILHDTGCLSRAKMSTMQAVTGLLDRLRK